MAAAPPQNEMLRRPREPALSEVPLCCPRRLGPPLGAGWRPYACRNARRRRLSAWGAAAVGAAAGEEAAVAFDRGLFGPGGLVFGGLLVALGLAAPPAAAESVRARVLAGRGWLVVELQLNRRFV